MVRSSKLYADRSWLWWAYHTMKYTPEEIAKISGSSVPTVYRYLKQYKIIK
jgi:transposase